MVIDILEDKHEVFWEVEAFDPHWQTHYDTLRAASSAANCLPAYYDYMGTSEGRLRHMRFLDVPDTVQSNRLERKMRERMLRRSNRENFDSE
jgi:hypothetical protein